jgi:hypothetical protein
MCVLLRRMMHDSRRAGVWVVRLFTLSGAVLHLDWSSLTPNDRCESAICAGWKLFCCCAWQP